MAQATAEQLGPAAQKPATSAQVSLPGLEVFVNLEGLIDKEKERARLSKEREKLTGLIGGKEKKLASANFVERAPAEVVERERQGLAQLQEQLASVKEALAALGG